MVYGTERTLQKYASGKESTMKKTYKISVDCPNCANKMEAALASTDGVVSATVNFMTQKAIMEFEDGADVHTIMQMAAKRCKRVDDDCEIYF